MAENERVVHLLDRELDGTITAVERDELERLIRVEPGLRREREAWRRVMSAIAVDAVRAPRVEVARMSARVLNARSRALRVPARWFMFGPRMLFAASTVAAIALVLFAAKQPAPEPERRAPVRVASAAAAVVVVAKPPVDVAVDEAGADDDRSALVEIRF